MSQKIRLLVRDGGRHRQPTGYGKNARSLILGLAADPDFDVSVSSSGHDWEIDDWYRDRLVSIPISDDLAEADVVLQLGAPGSCRRLARPNAMFTNIDVSGMSAAEHAALTNTNMILAPNRTNFELFSRHFPLVRLCQQGITEHFFRPQKRFRSEGPGKFSMIFVGSFSYRKGVDLLLRAFAEEFSEGEAQLTLHLPGEMADRANNFIIRTIRQVGRPIDISTATKTLSEAWMARTYNRHDAFVTMTRGEGWGLPIVEAMLCELPVVAPRSGGMLDYLDDEVAAPIETRTVRLDSITDPFGDAFVRSHDGPDVTLEEPLIASARRQMRRLADDAELRARLGANARQRILQDFSEARFVASVGAALKELVSMQASTAPALAQAAAPPEATTPRPVGGGEKLEIGAGDKPMAGYIHHDIRPLPDIEVICDARSFPAEHKGRYEEVYAANIIEHFNRFEVRKVLGEWVSLLRPGGTIKLITPDMREIATQLANNQITMEWFSYLMFGGQDYEFNKHGYAFDADSLAAMLESFGLIVVKKVPGITWEKRKLDRYCPMIQVWGQRPA